MDDEALFALGTMTHSSPAMFERRRRILREARRMIGTGGMDDFNIRELCRRAEVSTRTVYNAFGGKEALVALAIKDYFDAFHKTMTFVANQESFEGALERTMAATLRNLQIPNYFFAVAALHFSPTLDPQIRRVLLDIGRRQWSAWLRNARSRKQLEPGVDIEQLTVDLLDLQFSKVHRWGLGELAEDRLIDVTAASVLTCVAGATRGEARAAVRATLDALSRSTPEWHEFIAGIRLRIDQHWDQPAELPVKRQR